MNLMQNTSAFIIVFTIGIYILQTEKTNASEINKNQFVIELFEDNMPQLNAKKDCKNYLLSIRTTDKNLEYAVIHSREKFKFNLIKDNINGNVITYSGSKCVPPLKSINHTITMVTKEKNLKTGHRINIKKIY